MKNSSGISEYFQDLNSWTSEIQKKEKTTVTQAKVQEALKVFI